MVKDLCYNWLKRSRNQSTIIQKIIQNNKNNTNLYKEVGVVSSATSETDKVTNEVNEVTISISLSVVSGHEYMSFQKQ